MRYKIVSDKSDWQIGFNMRSKKRNEYILESINTNLKCKFNPFNIKFLIKKLKTPCEFGQ